MTKWVVLAVIALLVLWAVLHDMHQSSVRSTCTGNHSADYCRLVGR